MYEKECIPTATSLIESLRSVGYSFKTAIADLIDNCVSVKAKNISIHLETSATPSIVIFDDGWGMNEKELEEAMRYGSRNPNEERSEFDLGRFGLGMKSASLSQCRVLIVASKKGGKISCYSWNIDHIQKKGCWSLLGYNNTEIKLFPHIDLLDTVDSGTYVLLREFDRVSVSTADLMSTLKKYMDETINHISLVFHRYINDGVCIFVNGEKIKARDPFLQNNKATQHLREQKFIVNDKTITVNPYILPHISKLSKNDIELVGSKEEFRRDQGFYIYRNKRLIIWGTWFRLGNKDELSKLARVMVDIPNSLDYMWSIDVKKSSANLPDLIKKNLYNCVHETVFNSESVHQYRGRKNDAIGEINYIWERLKLRDGYKYVINREIPQVEILEQSLSVEQLRMLSKLLLTIENSFPVPAMYVDASKGLVEEVDKDDISMLFDDVAEQLKYAYEQNMDVNRIYKAFIQTEPYCKHQNLLEKLQEEVKKYV